LHVFFGFTRSVCIRHHHGFSAGLLLYLCLVVLVGAPRLITALHVASYHNQEDMVQLLLDKGIKVGAAAPVQ
jgi:hypothetical protein